MHVVGRANDNVERKGGIDCQAYFCRLIELISRRHYDQDIHIAIFMRRAISVRSKEHDPFRLESLSELSSELAYHTPWH